MKIGILTFHCAHNYGAVLQCYALQEILKSFECTVEIIDYRPISLSTYYRIFEIRRFVSLNPLRMIRKISKELKLIDKRVKRHNAFHRFIKSNINLSSRVSAQNISSKYDIYIMGSDQIWNPKITKGFDSVYFGTFKFPKGHRKYIAYAASMEFQMLDIVAKNYYRKALCNFDAISVREKELTYLLQPLTDKKIHTVLDPTFLLDKNIWHTISKKPNIQKKYVLVYQVRSDSNVLRIAENIAEQIDGTVIEIAANITILKRQFQDLSPNEFLGFIEYASCVVTTSFHATAFSVVCNRPFYYIKLNDGGDTRAVSLLKELNLENLIIDKSSNPKVVDIDFGFVNKKIMTLKRQSIDFLTLSIKE